MQLKGKCPVKFIVMLCKYIKKLYTVFVTFFPISYKITIHKRVLNDYFHHTLLPELRKNETEIHFDYQVYYNCKSNKSHFLLLKKTFTCKIMLSTSIASFDVVSVLIYN